MQAVADTYWFVFQDGMLVLPSAGGTAILAAQPPLPPAADALMHDLGAIDGHPCVAYAAEAAPDAGRHAAMTLRESYARLERRFYDKAGLGAQLLHWDATTRFCGRCGGRAERRGRIVKHCTVCGAEIFTQIAPAVIVLVRRADEALLVRAHNFKGTHHGLVAGFLEPGETLEECVVREVREETALEIENVRYFASQPWPYPCGVMVGFMADYASGEIRIQEEELRSAAWFRRDALPELPLKLSLARALIDAWLASRASPGGTRSVFGVVSRSGVCGV